MGLRISKKGKKLHKKLDNFEKQWYSIGCEEQRPRRDNIQLL